MKEGEKKRAPPRIFISYTQYEAAHSHRVLALAYALAADGLDVELDQFHGHETVDWPRWCDERLRPENTDFVLMVCSAEYRRRIDGRVERDQGRGVFWEGNLIYGYLYREKANERFVPILLDGEPEGSLPPAVANWNHFNLRDFGLRSGDLVYEDLYRLLTGQPATPKPDRGALVRLPPRPVPEVGSKIFGTPTKPTPGSNETATRCSRRVSPARHSKNAHTEHQSLATRIFGGLLLVFLFALFPFAPDSLPDYKHRILALCAALVAGLFGWFLSGEIGLRIEALKSRFGDLAIRASGGLALFVLVLVWWLSPLAPIESGGTRSGGEADEPAVRLQALAGNIRDATTGEPVSGVQVSLPEHGIEARSDALGRFEMQVRGPHQGSVELMARKRGYRPREQYATLGNASLDVDLEQEP